jgi:hypothetical protein
MCRPLFLCLRLQYDVVTPLSPNLLSQENIMSKTGTIEFQCPPGFKIVIPVPIKSEVVTTSKLDGMVCISCYKFSQYASPNQDNGTFICYMCRSQS